MSVFQLVVSVFALEISDRPIQIFLGPIQIFFSLADSRYANTDFLELILLFLPQFTS